MQPAKDKKRKYSVFFLDDSYEEDEQVKAGKWPSSEEGYSNCVTQLVEIKSLLADLMSDVTKVFSLTADKVPLALCRLVKDTFPVKFATKLQ